MHIVVYLGGPLKPEGPTCSALKVRLSLSKAASPSEFQCPAPLQ